MWNYNRLHIINLNQIIIPKMGNVLCTQNDTARICGGNMNKPFGTKHGGKYTIDWYNIILFEMLGIINLVYFVWIAYRWPNGLKGLINKSNYL